MKRPLMTFGRTLARPIDPAAGANFLAEAMIRRGRGSIMVAVTSTERPERFDVDAVLHDLTPTEALDALQIASARIGVIHRVPSSIAPVIAAADFDQLRAIAERIVDRHRAFGVWERLYSKVERFFQAPAGFRLSREQCIRELVAALNDQRQRAAHMEAAE